MKILVAEDEPTFREMLSGMLKRLGYDPLLASDGNEAWDIVATCRPPQLALIDWVMPGIDGIELCRKIRREKARPYMYLILLTGKNQEKDLVAGLEAGADDYLMKPLKHDELRVRLKAGRRILELQEQLVAARETERRRNMELEAINHSLERFGYSAAKQILSSLKAIAGAGKMIEEFTCPGADGRCMANTRVIYTKTKELGEMVASMQEFLKPRRIPLQPEQLDLSNMARAVVARLRAHEPSRRVDLSIADGISAFADRELLDKVLGKLLGNAWRHSSHRETASIEFGTTRIGDEQVFFVRDNGIGFERDFQDQIFIPFFRIPGTDTLAGKGIGLATVDRIVRRHGGRIWAEAAPGKGATFYFTLPLTRESSVCPLEGGGAQPAPEAEQGRE